MIVATLGNTIGSLIAYAIALGRPAVPRAVRSLRADPTEEIELAERFFQRYGARDRLLRRLIPIVRTFISFPAGVARMPLGKFIAYRPPGRSLVDCWSGPATQLGAHWQDIRHALQPFDTVIAVVVVVAVCALHLVAARPAGLETQTCLGPS